MIKRALISLSDKTNLEKIVLFLLEKNVEIVSTGGTYKAIAKITDKVIEISDYTGFPEIMDGRVKTLNPLVHGGILADREKESHLADMEANDIGAIDLVIVNLYPFEDTVAGGCSFAQAIEKIDVGGPTMIRAAAKNHNCVTVICDIADYDSLILEMGDNDGSTSLEFRQKMAVKVFAQVASYDAAIYNHLSSELQQEKDLLVKPAKLKQKLRYGENPHQEAKLYQFLTSENSGILGAKKVQGKELSFNNINDADNAYNLIKEFSDLPAAAIIKHANPCGVATGNNICDAFIKALSGDPVSSFGGIVALNRELDEVTAEKIKKIFFEVIIAPSISDKAKEILASKKNMRILLVDDLTLRSVARIRDVSGGFLVQDEDIKQVTIDDLDFVTKRQPSEEEVKNMLFAFSSVKHVRSNAVLFASEQMTVGIGAGQMSRVDAVRIASLKLEDFCKINQDFSKKNLALASDAFFPFADGLELAAKAGATAIIQPGGSVRDDEVIAKADEYGLTMAFTKIRHFKH